MEEAKMENRNHSYGSVIALEGPPDTVSTQLRLLPTSSQLLVLPSLQSYMEKISGGPSHTRSLVKQVHDAAQKRHEVAVQFLKEASPTNKRLVFLNGGTAGAVSHCMTAISENETSGDIHQADLMFRSIALEGLRGLDRQDKQSDQATLRMLGRQQTPGDSILDSEDTEDPITRAMRAADLLYKETDSLQPIDCYIRTRPRSLSLPMYGYSDGMGEPSPFFVFGSAPHEENQLRSDADGNKPGDHQGMAEDEFAKLCAIKIQPGTSEDNLPVLDHAASYAGESYNHHIAEPRSSTRRSDALLSPPATPDGETIVYGEARLVQMRASKTQVTLRESRSLDDLELEQTRSRRTDFNVTPVAEQEPPLADNPEAKSRHLSITDKPYSANTLLRLPQARFVKAHTTTIRRSPTFVRHLPKPAKDSYVHRGTDAADFQEERHELDEPFQPVLPVVEDLVIHMNDHTTDAILNMVVEHFKAGAFPVVPFPSSLQTAPTDSCPSTPRTADLFDLEEDMDTGLSPVIEHPAAEEIGEYDPFAARGRDVRISSLALQPPSPPPPASVPPDSRQPPISPPIQRERESRFHDFSTVGQANAVATQNALRSVLQVYFPPPSDGSFNQFSLPMFRDIGSLWRPIFGDKEARDGGSDENAPDMILAMGRQNGVQREFLSTLTGQVEKLGTKSSGMSRSGRLDLRYLIVNAMQSLAAQPLAHQTQKNRFDDPYLLAGLIIPQLETYLAANYGTRFLLLEYPAEHLATVLALQKLVGMEVFKVAGIIDSEATSPSPSGISSAISSRHSSHYAAPFSNADTNGLDSFNLPGSPFPDERTKTVAHQKKYSFSEANYLLTSSATESEISVFIASITKDLTEVDPFYTPEISSPPPARPGTAKSTKGTAASGGALPTLMSKFTLQGPNGSPAYTHTAVFGPPANLPVSPPYTNDGDGGSGRSTPRVITAPGAAAYNFPFPPPPAPRSPSPAPSAASSRSRGSRGPGAGPGVRARSLTRRRLGKLGNEGGPDDGASMYAVSVVEDGEFYDEEEKRLMPLYMRQSEMRKGNSRKALKWLGLA